MSVPPAIRIRVYPQRELKLRPRLFRALEETFSVTFSGIDEIDPNRSDPLIVLADAEKMADAIEAGRCPHLIIHHAGAATASSGKPAIFRLHELPSTKLNLSSFPMREDAWEEKKLAPLGKDFAVAASTEHGPVWVWRRAAGWLHSETVLSPAELKEGEWLVDYLRPGRFAGLLPLFMFMQRVTQPTTFEPIRPMATLVVDDPNLHWGSYGYVNFKDLIQHARDHQYHVAIATVPLDSWWFHKGTAALFRKNPGTISLLMHGINHTLHELVQPRSDEQALQLFGQALRRVDDLEKRAGLKVARVMEPPFGVCGTTSMRAMRKLGYQASYLSPDVALQNSRTDQWPANFGLSVADPSWKGFPVIPRLRILEDWKTGAAIKLCLGLPVVVATHHTDAVENFRHFGEVADLINGVGGVHWCDAQEMAESLYESRIDGFHMVVRPFARDVSVRAPEGVQSVTIAAVFGEGQFLVEFDGTNGKPIVRQELKSGESVRLNGAKSFRVYGPTDELVDYRSLSQPPIWPWAYVRRTLTAVRDRTRPLIKPGKNGLNH